MLEYQSVQRFGTVEREAETELAIQFAQQAAAFHQITAVRLAMKTRRLQRRVGREFPDQFLDDIFEREQPHELTILVDDEAKAVLVLLELLQLREKRRGRRDKIRLPHDL